jgi:hypothetical protein
MSKKNWKNSYEEHLRRRREWTLGLMKRLPPWMVRLGTALTRAYARVGKLTFAGIFATGAVGPLIIAAFVEDHYWREIWIEVGVALGILLLFELFLSKHPANWIRVGMLCVALMILCGARLVDDPFLESAGIKVGAGLILFILLELYTRERIKHFIEMEQDYFDAFLGRQMPSTISVAMLIIVSIKVASTHKSGYLEAWTFEIPNPMGRRYIAREPKCPSDRSQPNFRRSTTVKSTSESADLGWRNPGAAGR